MKTLFILILLSAVVLAEPVLIYSGYTNKPSFACPNDAIKCELYQTTGSWTKLDKPILKNTCAAGSMCSFTNNVGMDGGRIRCLPGDVCMATAGYEGYKLMSAEDVVFPANSTNTTTSQTNTTESSQPPMCKAAGLSCFMNGDCCSNKCIRMCGRYSIHNLCLSYRSRCG